MFSLERQHLLQKENICFREKTFVSEERLHLVKRETTFATKRDMCDFVHSYVYLFSFIYDCMSVYFRISQYMYLNLYMFT